ncbi:MAG TPA: bifunctional UDP-N-acetylmuramoyl-tripeptide:D-alanyl-D-alanine ligase/alanine racemase [Chryseosolibacter sp.]|nr:bifunctional UDP-N-acetylmuramoyl-tripeptide:D-alanyl-D-alanine ligase/alanine racemase [Chryseosolibacter sp.]
MIYFSQLPEITNGTIRALHEDQPVSYLLIDSRKAAPYQGAIFFAIKGVHHDGHQFISALYEKGIRQFVLEYIPPGMELLRECNVIEVKSSVEALQRITIFHRSSLKIPVIGITGSNGKTIIKEWLFTLLSPDHRIAKNPGSYNSQVGVPLSVWQLDGQHELGIFEAGISRPGEMKRLAAIIQPSIGIFTNLGTAHDEGFASAEEKISEKLKLFESAKTVIYCRDHAFVHEHLTRKNIPALSWGFHDASDIRVRQNNSILSLTYQKQEFAVPLPFTDAASVENCMHCIALLFYLGYQVDKIRERILLLRSVPMRLELKQGVNQCQLIDDTYNNDLAGLQISLDFLANQHQKKKKSVILSDILESGAADDAMARAVVELISGKNLHQFIGIGKRLASHSNVFPSHAQFFHSTDEFLSSFDLDRFNDEIILIKGARAFRFEQIVNRLQRKVHGTVMEIDLGAVVDNLNHFKSILRPETKIMVMVKAFAYGSGSVEIANVLQYHKVDYLGVAYADEGIELRKNNIAVPVMVMNPSPESFQSLLDYNLEPEIYSFRILEEFLRFLGGRAAAIHLKLDTGMHRLGFEPVDIPGLLQTLSNNPQVRVSSIFSHLAGADDAAHDDFSNSQAKLFRSMADDIAQRLGYRPIYHLLNSPGILRHPQLQFDMVRLGIGLYGIDPTKAQFKALKPVATLKTIVSQVKHIKAGDTIGYGRRGKAEHDMSLATIAIGYADGFSRAFSRGVGHVVIRGRPAPVVGNVCMDMTMVDVTGISVAEGDEVIVFGKENPIHQLAEKINTIPYEILTSTSERVKRVFVAESI